MAFLVGTDEAGYGPNLGPLVIVGTLWSVPDDLDADSLYEHLPGIVPPGEPVADHRRTLVLGDSKSLYQPRGGLAALERGIFAALAAMSAPIKSRQVGLGEAFWSVVTGVPQGR